MLRVDQVHVIRHKVLVEGQSCRRVAREMGFSRNTVRKYLEEPEPVRKEESPRARPVFDQVRGRMDELLDEWKTRTTKKQRLTGTRLHRELLKEGHTVGITVVRDYLRERRRRKAEVFVPLIHHPGDEAQVDFFEVAVDIAGQRRKAWMFVMRLMYSGRDFVWLYDRQDQVAFLDGHVRAFEHFGAVPNRCIYDNLKPAVARVMFPKRELTDRFRALASHYLFEPCFARPGTGHDKGGVESRGRGIRWQHLVPVPSGPDLQAINATLLAEVDQSAATKTRKGEKQTVLERFADELPKMLPLPSTTFEARKLYVVHASRSAQVRVEGSWYSVPSHWSKLRVNAYVGPDAIELVCRDERARHPRTRFGTTSTQYRHYLPELAKKPQAVRQVASALIQELGKPYDELWRMLVDRYGPRDAGRVFARFLGLVVDHGEGVVGEVIERALKTGDLERIGLSLSSSSLPETNAVPEPLSVFCVESACAADFDALLWEGAHE